MKTVLITGATDGIGLATASALLALDWRVLVHGRSEARARSAAHNLSTAGGAAIPVWGDFTRLREVATLADQVRTLAPSLSVLINNAGVYDKQRAVTEDGFERTFAVNYLAHFLLTRRLLPCLLAAPGARVIHVSSGTHHAGQLDFTDLQFTTRYDAYQAYCNSKLANVLFSNALAARYLSKQLTSNALHPGVIATKLLRVGFGADGAPVASGAETSVHLATSSALEARTGGYFSEGRTAKAARAAGDLDLAERLWAVSETLTAGFG